MDRKNVEALLASGVLQAIAEGKTIQQNISPSIGKQEWYDITVEDAFDIACDGDWGVLRVKPEPLHDWVVERNHKCDYYIVHQKTATHMKQQYSGRHYRQLVDVLDEGC